MPVTCDEIIKKALKRQMNDGQIYDYLDKIKDMFAAYKKAAQNPADAAAKAQADALKKKVEAIASRRASLIQSKRRIYNTELVLNEYQGMERIGIESLIVGSQHNRKGSHFSVDHLARGLEEFYTGSLYTGINRLGSSRWKLFKSGSLDLEIARALELVESPGKFTGPGEAMDIAKVLHEVTERSRLDQNRAGATILKLTGYITRQSHDQARILKAGPEEWKKFVASRLDWTRTADGAFDPNADAAAADEFLEGVWKAFASGIHEKPQGGAPANPLRQAGVTGMKAAKLNKNRVLHFKNADAWFEYNELYGRGTLRDAVQAGLRSAAQNTALMRVFGPSPKAGLDAVINNVQRGLKKKGDFQGIEKIRRWNRRFNNDYLTVDGSANIAGNPTMARVGANIRSWNNMTSLGGVLLSSITDMPSFATEFAYQGQPFFKSLTDGFKSFLHGRGSIEQQEILADCGVFFDSMNAELCARFSGSDFTGKINAASNLFFRINGLSLWTDAWKKAAGLMMAHNFASIAGSGWQDLKQAQRRLFSLYGLDEDAWELVRHTKQKAADGRNYLTPSQAQDIPEAEIKRLLDRQGKKYSKSAAAELRDDIEDRLRTLIRDRVSYAVLEPDARTRSFLYQGTPGGTGAGEALRFVLQFKSFPVAFMQKLMGRELLGRESGSYAGGLLNNLVRDRFGEYSNFARMFLMMTLFGYGAMSVKQLLAGKTPHDPALPQTWLAAAAQGGGLGIYGDFLFGSKSRIGSSFLGALAGPTLSKAESVVNLWYDTRDNLMGEGSDLRANAIRLAMNLTPGNNLFYFRSAFDYLIGYNLFEMISPGYIARTRRRIKKENGQNFYLKPLKW